METAVIDIPNFFVRHNGGGSGQIHEKEVMLSLQREYIHIICLQGSVESGKDRAEVDQPGALQMREPTPREFKNRVTNA
jgi:hypothetical protein